MTLDHTVYLLWYANIAASTLLLTRLMVTRLYLTYPFLFAYFIVDVVEDLSRLFLAPNKNVSSEFYFFGQTAKVFLAVLVVLQLYRIGLAGYPALRHFGQGMVGVALLCVLVAIGIETWFNSHMPTVRYKVMHYGNVLERTVDWLVFVLLVVIAGFLAWFPVRTNRNVRVFLGGFLAYFFTHPVFLFLSERFPHYRLATITIRLSSSFLIISAMAVLMRANGESMTAVVGHSWNPAEMKRLMKLLRGYNERLRREIPSASIQ